MGDPPQLRKMEALSQSPFSGSRAEPLLKAQGVQMELVQRLRIRFQALLSCATQNSGGHPGGKWSELVGGEGVEAFLTHNPSTRWIASGTASITLTPSTSPSPPQGPVPSSIGTSAVQRDRMLSATERCQRASENLVVARKVLDEAQVSKKCVMWC